MLRQVRRMLDRITWTAGDVTRFLGCYLTEPEPHISFRRPARPLTRPAFVARVARSGLRLDLKTQMLFHGRQIFINGECCRPEPGAAPLLRRLADRRQLRGRVEIRAEAAELLYQWYRSGYVAADEGARPPIAEQTTAR